MTRRNNDAMETIMQQLIEQGPDSFRSVLEQLFGLAMILEREQFLQAREYERTPQRRGYANGYEGKTIDTPAGTLRLRIPRTRDHADEPFYPHSLERGQRVTRTVMLALAQMWVDGVSTRRTEKILGHFGLQRVSSSQVSRANALLDEELSAWRKRSLGEVRYLVLDARYERTRMTGIVRDTAVLSAVGVDARGKRLPLGVSVALDEAEVHWRSFLESLTQRGMHGVRYIVSDDHAGLRAARKAVFPAAPWQRCQFHLGQNALRHCPNQKIRGKIGAQLRAIWDSQSIEEAQDKLCQLAQLYGKDAPQLAAWLEDNISEGFTVFMLPKEHHKKMRTTNGIERPIQQELKRRTQIVRVFPNTDSLLRLVTAILMEIEEKWMTRRYITWNDEMPDLLQNQIYTDQVA